MEDYPKVRKVKPADGQPSSDIDYKKWGLIILAGIVALGLLDQLNRRNAPQVVYAPPPVQASQPYIAPTPALPAPNYPVTQIGPSGGQPAGSYRCNVNGQPGWCNDNNVRSSVPPQVLEGIRQKTLQGGQLSGSYIAPAQPYTTIEEHPPGTTSQYRCDASGRPASPGTGWCDHEAARR